MVVSRDADARRAVARDASGLEMVPDAVARAESVDNVVAVVQEASAKSLPVTVAGSQTSMTGASITDRGILLSVSAMNRVLEVDEKSARVRVEPGVTIGQLNRELASYDLMFAPDPTSEEDATIGGAIACNASGARSLYYGATRRHVTGVRVVNADASVSTYGRSHGEKNTVGYAAAQDPVDWFIGSEGTLGIVVEAELSLVRRPANIVGLAVPFRASANALEFVVAAREGKSGRLARCLEYFDSAALAIAGASIGASWTTEAGGMIYLEDDAGNGEVDSVLTAWLALAENHSAIADDIQVFEGAQPLRDARAMRHAVPATMNERGSAQMKNGGRKVSTDWAVPYRLLEEALAASATAVAKFGAPSPVTYGHAGNGHPHQNFIARDAAELGVINSAIEETLAHVINVGGTVSAEHGLGKLKQKWLVLQLSQRQIAVMKAIKNTLDPSGMFAPGNVL